MHLALYSTQTAFSRHAKALSVLSQRLGGALTGRALNIAGLPYADGARLYYVVLFVFSFYAFLTFSVVSNRPRLLKKSIKIDFLYVYTDIEQYKAND